MAGIVSHLPPAHPLYLIPLCSRNSLLAKGLVSSLEVVNRTKVRVHLHAPIPNNGGMNPGSVNGSGNGLPSPAHGPAPYVFTIGSVEAFEQMLLQSQDELGIPPAERIPVSYREEISTAQTILHFAPTLLIGGLILYMARRGAQGAGGVGGGIFGVGKSKAKMFNKEEEVAIRFKDVAGMDEAKEVSSMTTVVRTSRRLRVTGNPRVRQVPQGPAQVRTSRRQDPARGHPFRTSGNR